MHLWVQDGRMLCKGLVGSTVEMEEEAYTGQVKGCEFVSIRGREPHQSLLTSALTALISPISDTP